MRVYLRLALRELGRNKQPVVLIITFLAMGMLTVVSNFYLKELLKGSAGITPQVLATIPTPSWYTLSQGLFRNNMQICMLVAAYIMALACTPGKSQSARAFYSSNLPSGGMLLLARALAVSIVVSIAYLIAYAVCLTLIQSLVGDIPWGVLIFYGFWQLFIILTICWLSGATAAWTRAPVLGVIVALFCIVTALISGQTSKASMEHLFDGHAGSYLLSLHGFLGQFFFICGLLILAVVALYKRPLRSVKHIQWSVQHESRSI